MILVITPRCLTLTGGLIQIGVSKVKVAMSIGLSVPIGTVLLDHKMLFRFNTLRLVQSI